MNSDFRQTGNSPSFGDTTRSQPPEDKMFRGGEDDSSSQRSPIDADRLKQDGVALKDKAIDRLTSEADSRKGMVSQQLKSVSSALGAAEDGLSKQEGESPEWLKSGLRQVATTVGDLADRVQNKGSAELVGEVKTFAQNNPATFLFACAAVGFAAARVFKASDSESSAPTDSFGSPARRHQL